MSIRQYPKLEVRRANGLPLLMQADVQGPDPSTGIMSPWVDDYQLFWLHSPKIEIPKHLYDEIDQQEFESLAEQYLKELEKFCQDHT